MRIRDGMHDVQRIAIDYAGLTHTRLGGDTNTAGPPFPQIWGSSKFLLCHKMLTANFFFLVDAPIFDGIAIIFGPRRRPIRPRGFIVYLI